MNKMFFPFLAVGSFPSNNFDYALIFLCCASLLAVGIAVILVAWHFYKKSKEKKGSVNKEKKQKKESKSKGSV